MSDLTIFQEMETQIPEALGAEKIAKKYVPNYISWADYNIYSAHKQANPRAN